MDNKIQVKAVVLNEEWAKSVIPEIAKLVPGTSFEDDLTRATMLFSTWHCWKGADQSHLDLPEHILNPQTREVVLECVIYEDKLFMEHNNQMWLVDDIPSILMYERIK